MSGARAAAVLLAAVCLAAVPALAAPALAAPALAAPGGALPQPDSGCLGQQGAPPSPQTPWPQRVLDYGSVWGLTQGRGIKVAVIDSGVDDNPQFRDRVIVAQTLAAAPFGPAAGDCVGHGTSVAGIIAAAPRSGVGFAGVAPRATIISIKITNTKANIQPGMVALAIHDAVNDGANVINLSLHADNTPALQSAVNFALNSNVVVVAAAGNDTAQSGPGPFYPANYPGVLSVGAVEPDGSLANFSDKQTHITVTAPGDNVTSTFPGRFPHSYAAQGGTSFAAPFVAGVAALVWSYHHDLTAEQVVQRIQETADGAAGPGTGNGLVNPVEAVTAVLPRGSASSGTGLDQGRVSIDRAAPDRNATRVAMSVTGGAFGLAVVVIAIAVVIGAGRRRRRQPEGM